MRLLKTFCTIAMITTCLSTSGNTADMVSTDLETAKSHARQHFKNNPISAFKGHSPLTGNDVHDATLIQKAADSISSEEINTVRDEFNNIRRNQIIFALVDAYGIDPSSTHLTTRSEEYDRIESETANARVGEIVTQTCDPAFAVIAEIRTALQNELPKNILGLAKKGNTVAAQYIWQNIEIPEKWLKSLIELQQDAATKDFIKTQSDAGSVLFQYLLARSVFIAEGVDNATKMTYLENLGTSTETELGIDAATDYWGVLRYIDLISRNETNETAANDWLDLFTKTAKLSLGQHIITRLLHDKSGKPLPRGYIDALRQFSGIPTEPIHLVLRKIVENTRSQGLAECYIVKYMYDFPDTKSLGFEDKLAEIRTICDIVPKAKSMLANIIMASTPGSSLGYSEKTLQERREALVELANAGDPKAKSILAQANAGTIGHNNFDDKRKHLGYEEATDLAITQETLGEYLRINQERTANIFYLAFRGSKTAQRLILEAPVLNEVDTMLAKISTIGLNLASHDSEALTTEPAIEPKSILQFNLEMLQSVFDHKPAGERQGEANKEAPNLLKQQFAEVNILTQENDFTGGPIDFLTEVEIELDKAEKD